MRAHGARRGRPGRRRAHDRACAAVRGAARLACLPPERGPEQRDRLHRDERAEGDGGVAPEAVREQAPQRVGLGEAPAVPGEEEAVEAAEEADGVDRDVDAGEGGDPEVSTAPAARPSRRRASCAGGYSQATSPSDPERVDQVEAEDVAADDAQVVALLSRRTPARRSAAARRAAPGRRRRTGRSSRVRELGERLRSACVIPYVSGEEPVDLERPGTRGARARARRSRSTAPGRERR